MRTILLLHVVSTVMPARWSRRAAVPLCAGACGARLTPNTHVRNPHLAAGLVYFGAYLAKKDVGVGFLVAFICFL